MSTQKHSDALAKEIAENIVWFASLMDDVKWLRDETEKRDALPASAAEFGLYVEAEKAKGLSEVEALHAVAREHPEFYDAYRNAVFIDGSL